MKIMRGLNIKKTVYFMEKLTDFFRNYCQIRLKIISGGKKAKFSISWCQVLPRRTVGTEKARLHCEQGNITGLQC